MEIVLRATLIYFFLFVLTRVLGKRELSQMSAFEMILLVSMGDLVQQGITQEDMSITGAVVAVSTIACWVLLFSWTAWRWPRTQPVIEGLPVVVVRDGEVLSEAMFLERMPIEDLMGAAREHGIEHLGQVRLAVLEPEGTISFVRADDG